MILIVEDEAAVRFTLLEALEAYPVLAVDSAEAALPHLERADLVLTDFALPGMNGLELLRKSKTTDSEVPVILLTARGDERLAVEAIKAGAYDYLPKPFRLPELRAVVARAVELRQLRRAARQQAAEHAIGRAIVGKSAAWKKVLDAAHRVGQRDVTVLLRGETGTGKELIARLLHAVSPRQKQPLVRFNCAALTAELADAELFGHTQGAFTGATQDRAGLFEQANGGTLFLDEVAELPPPIQAKLLRALQEGEIQPVGGKVRQVNVRIIAATHRDLISEARSGRFREDLYYRLAVVELTLPTLAQRLEDLPLLVECFRARHAERFGIDSVCFEPQLLDALASRPWPGNVRELENVVQRLLALSDEGRVGLEALGQPAAPAPHSLRERLESFERQILAQTLDETGNNHSESARRLGITRTTLLDKLRRYGFR